MSHWEAPGKSDEWFTPKYIFEALGCTFDIDVATTCSPHVCVPAKGQIFNGSLETEWHGFVWMNPPFEGRNGLEPWLRKFVEHRNGICLTPDRTSAPWFQQYGPMMDSIIFTPKIRFIRPDGSEGKSPSNGTALMGIGPAACFALSKAMRKGLGFGVMPFSTPPPRMSATSRLDREKKERKD